MTRDAITGQFLPVPAADRFIRKIDKTDTCWEWQGARFAGGYGMFNPTHTTTVTAHRFAYELFVGPIPDGLDIDHLCRNRSCVNPAHMEPVTEAENTRRGLTAKLRVEDVREIRRLLSLGMSQSAVARRFGVTQTNVCCINRRHTWRDVA